MSAIVNAMNAATNEHRRIAVLKIEIPWLNGHGTDVEEVLVEECGGVLWLRRPDEPPITAGREFEVKAARHDWSSDDKVVATIRVEKP